MKLPPRLPAYKLVALAIKEFIELNGLKKGDALPAEAAFAQQLGISRPSLREGVKALESVGVLESRHGEGVYVADFSFDPIVDNLPYSLLADDAQLLHLLEVRTALEVGMIPKIVQIVPAQDLIKLRQLASRMHELALRDISFEDEDREFHATLFGCLNNPFLNRLVDLFWQVFHRMSDSLPRSDSSSRRQTALEHIAIVEKLERGDAAGLQQAHERHFEEIHKRIMKLRNHPDGAMPSAVQLPANRTRKRPAKAEV
ncbi:MAG TPA: FadR/GntR family transcriptional regulator [Burkholderiaceae bacterium]|nr:FadR/GntR family transcriptional regulator [Burkholderiaceae bacterium]